MMEVVAMLRILLMSLILLFAGTTAFADRMSGADVAGMMAAGPLAFEAGSVGVFNGDGSYVFEHQKYTEEGTFKVFSNGNVEIYDERKKRTVRFHFVRQKDGRPALIYAKGNGKEYRMRK
jgi:hypothetical protein